jgi:hypothetical protein
MPRLRLAIARSSLAVATWIEAQSREFAAPSVKQWLAALRHLFDRLVMCQVVQTNPAASVRRAGASTAKDRRRADGTGLGARGPHLEGLGIAKIRRQRQSRLRQGRHPVDFG